MMKPWIGSKAWFLGLISVFFIGNLIFWNYNPRAGGCPPNTDCNDYYRKLASEQLKSIASAAAGASAAAAAAVAVPGEAAKSLPPVPPLMSPVAKPAAPAPPAPPAAAPKEAKLDPVLILESQPIKHPDTFIPSTHLQGAKDLPLISPTADEITMRLKDKKVGYAGRNEQWNFGLINSKPDVLIASAGRFGDVANHYNREHRIYTLMKWILRVYRRDPSRTSPLLMVDAGANHGLFSMVATTNGAHVVAFEPQTHLRSVIGFGARLNRVASRLRVLPFGVLDEYRKVAMAQYDVKDGGIAHLDLAAKDSVILTQTIRLDSLPAFAFLFPTEDNDQTLVNSPGEIDSRYAAALDAATINNDLHVAASSLDQALVLRQPIHFLKIDVEGFELQALESATGLFEQGLVEHAVLEFGPPNRWDGTVQDANFTQAQKRAQTTAHAKQLLHRAVDQWNMDIYLLPAIGWERTIKWMIQKGVSFNPAQSTQDDHKIVHRLKAWDFDHQPQEHDEFERELDGKKQLVTETIPLRPDLIDEYMDILESIGEMYLWFAKRDSNPAVLAKLEI